MDCLMPQMDGYQATIEIRKKEQGTGQFTPIIALTANALNDAKSRCLEIGMDSFIAKPFDIDELYEVILSILRKYKRS
jgi:CheY-like chemotaxis protein